MYYIHDVMWSVITFVGFCPSPYFRTILFRFITQNRNDCWMPFPRRHCSITKWLLWTPFPRSNYQRLIVMPFYAHLFSVSPDQRCDSSRDVSASRYWFARRGIVLFVCLVQWCFREIVYNIIPVQDFKNKAVIFWEWSHNSTSVFFFVFFKVTGFPEESHNIWHYRGKKFKNKVIKQS